MYEENWTRRAIDFENKTVKILPQIIRSEDQA